MTHRKLRNLSGLLFLSLVFAASSPGEAHEFQSRFDGIEFVRISSGCGMAGDRDQIKIDRETLSLPPDPAEPFCDAAILSKYLRQFLHAGLLKPGGGRERSREEIVRNYVTWAPAGGAKTLWISLYVWIIEVADANRSPPIHLCTYMLERRISVPNASDFWAQSDLLTVVCEDKSEVASTGITFVEPMMLDTITQLRRAR
jgi:hypothetical protein